MPDKKGTPKSVQHENRRRRYENRTKLENKLGHKLPSNMHAHHSGNGLKPVDASKHGSLHGRGNKGVSKVYKRK